MPDEPVVLPVGSFRWECSDWRWPQWLHFLNKISCASEVEFRIGRRNELPDEEPQWERRNKVECATFEQFLSWAGCLNENALTSRLSQYKTSTHWAYYAYVYMHQWKQADLELFNKLGVDWAQLGLPGQDAGESVFWLGSAGAHTLCHYDTYGCNMVVQLMGRKRWTLYPPSDTAHLYPTRVPYEESSVLSAANLRAPNLHKFPQVFSAHCRVVELQPGQALFVPRHWWHLVESVDTSLSINTWIPLEEDHQERLHEMLVACLMTALPLDQHNISNSLQTTSWQWSECLSHLRETIRVAAEHEADHNNSSAQSRLLRLFLDKGTVVSEIDTRTTTNSALTESSTQQSCSSDLKPYTSDDSSVSRVDSKSDDHQLPDCGGKLPDSQLTDETLTAALFEAVSHPHVVAMISENLLKNLKLRSQVNK